MSSRRRNRSGSEAEERTSRKHRRRDEKDEEDYHGSSGDYKALYKQLKSDLKSERRTIEDLEYKIDEERRAARKAKQDTTDLWKIYYQLQTELQESYEKNSQQSKQKEALQKELETLKSEYDKIRTGTVDPVRLKEALMAMQKEKLDMQKRFNDIVIENKKLREKEARYAPRITEMEKALKTVAKTKVEVLEMTAKVHKIKHDLTLINFNKESVDKYQRWNSMLSLECDQNSYLLRQIDADKKCTSGQRTQKIPDAVRELQSTIRIAKADWMWTGSALVDSIKHVKLDFANDIRKIMNEVKKICKVNNIVVPTIQDSELLKEPISTGASAVDNKKYFDKFTEITKSLESCLDNNEAFGSNLDLRANVHLLHTTLQLWSTTFNGNCEQQQTTVEPVVDEPIKPAVIQPVALKNAQPPPRFGAMQYSAYDN